MNTPNKFTLLRILLVPFLTVALLWADFPYHYTVAFAIFVIASLTDFFDGYLARKYDLITDFGKFLDPLADKMLVCAALVCFIDLGLTPSYLVIIIIAREFAVTSLRLIASGKGTVIPANMFGKLKTISQMVAIISIMLMQAADEFSLVIPGVDYVLIGLVLMWVATAFTVLSGFYYIFVNRENIKF